jgi:tRNA dimethylallyltransferase
MLKNSNRKKIIIIAGPTASGKTDLAIKIAAHFNTEIISADSRQCFKELDIGVAKPSAAQLATVHHYFINSHSVTQNISAADFESYALDASQKIFEQNNVAVMCGGTGLYIKAFCEGLDNIPEIDPEIKTNITQSYSEEGIDWLTLQLQNEDPVFFAKGEMKNPHRMLRALEVKRSTGKSIILHQTKQKKQRDFDVLKFCIDVPRADLYNRINNRVDGMMKQGLREEVESLISFKHFNALQTVGYKELFSFLENKISLAKAIDLIKQNTRNYAKRQVTWFKKDSEMKFVTPDNLLIQFV